MTPKIFDIETAPLPNLIDIINDLYPFNPDNVSGIQDNWKQETKDKKIEEAQANHLPSLIAKAQLDPALSFICSFGLMNLNSDENKMTICMSPDEEKDGLEEFFAMLNDPNDIIQLIGFYIETFDMEFCWRRAWNHRIKPPVMYRRGRYWNSERVIDLKDNWTFSNKINPWPSLERVAKILGIEYENRPVGVEGQHFWYLLSSGDPSDHARAIQYAFGDLVETKRLAQIIL